jgi:hypothetical protein
VLATPIDLKPLNLQTHAQDRPPLGQQAFPLHQGEQLGPGRPSGTQHQPGRAFASHHSRITWAGLASRSGCSVAFLTRTGGRPQAPKDPAATRQETSRPTRWTYPCRGGRSRNGLHVAQEAKKNPAGATGWAKMRGCLNRSLGGANALSQATSPAKTGCGSEHRQGARHHGKVGIKIPIDRNIWCGWIIIIIIFSKENRDGVEAS